MENNNVLHYHPPHHLETHTRKLFSTQLTIKQFRLGEVLGSGATSQVFAAFTDLPEFAGKSLAIKRINKCTLKSQKDRQRIVQEIETQRSIKHRSIIELYAAFQDDQYAFLVLEQCEGGTLADYLDIRQRLSESETRFVLLQVVDGLMYLADHHMFHRDLKPTNIMLTACNDIKLGDLGLVARRIPTGSANAQHTVCGTINYMAPEVVAKQPYSSMVDIWSLGCLAVTVLTGKPPFEPTECGRDPASVRMETLQRAQLGQYTLPRNLSALARDLVASLLQGVPDRRLPLHRVLAHPFFGASLPVNRLPLVSDLGRGPPPARPVSVSTTTHSIRRNPSIRSSYVAEPSFPLQPPAHITHSTNASHELYTSQGSYAHHDDPPIHSQPNLYNLPNPSVTSLPTHNQSAKLQRPPITRPYSRPLSSTRSYTNLIPVVALDTKYLGPKSHETRTAILDLALNPTLGDAGDLDVIVTARASGTKLIISPSQQNRMVVITHALPSPTQYYYPNPGIPSELIQMHELARRYIEQRKKVTARVILYTPQANVALMVNGSIDARFPLKGIRIVITPDTSSSQGQVRVYPPNSQPHIDLDSDHAHPTYEQLVSHVRLAARECHAAQTEAQVPNVSGHPNSKNRWEPLIIKTRSAVHASSHDLPEYRNKPPGRTRGRPTSAPPPVLLHGSNVPDPRAPSTARSDSGYHTSEARSRTSLGSPTLNVDPIYIQDIGWCTRTLDHEYSVLFLDGALVTVRHYTSTAPGWVKYAPPPSLAMKLKSLGSVACTKMYALKPNSFPAEVAERLQLYRTCLEEFRRLTQGTG